MKHRTPTRTLQLALRYLRELTAQGVEFPDAHFRASSRYHLTDEQDREVVQLYDSVESSGEEGH